MPPIGATVFCTVSAMAHAAPMRTRRATLPRPRPLDWKKSSSTATRREESISRLPISITAIGQEALDQKGIKGFLGRRPFHARCGVRHQPDKPDLDSWNLLERRLGHDRNLHRRRADSSAQPGLQFRRCISEAFRPRPGRGAARSAGHPVRRRLGRWHGPLHHDAAQSHSVQHQRQSRNVLHRGRIAELRNPASPAECPSSTASWACA